VAGLTGQARLDASQMIKAAMTMIEVMRDARSITSALSNELNGKQKGMAGDDDAGRALNENCRSRRRRWVQAAKG
jgi:hypothetical protein